MKDLPHHIKQLNRKVLRSEKREDKDEEEFSSEYRIEPSEKQKKKQAKQAKKKEKLNQIPHPEEPEESNKIQKSGRVPQIKDRSTDLPHRKLPHQG